MQASVEISMYPLEKDYKKPILDFIQRMKNYPKLRVEPNNMSTQIFGDYEEIMQMLTIEMKRSFERDPATIMVAKFINSNLKE